MKNKNYRLLIAATIAALTLTACGGSGATGNYSKSESAYDVTNDASEYYAGDDYYDEDYKEYTEEAAEVTEDASAGSGMNSVDNSATTTTTAEKNSLAEKMVYYGTVNIDTLEFDDSVTKFRNMIKENGGFVENETFTDGNYSEYNYQYVDSSEKNQRYDATVRIPSGSYESIMNSLSDLGDIRNKESRTENFSREYKDLSISLDIYKQTYDRYAELMKTAQDEDYILELQEKMTDLQIKIEQTKSRMNTIDTDVQYSYLTVVIREVYKYEKQVPQKDNFLTRLTETISDSASSFLEVLEGLLYVIIYLLPYIIIGLIIFFIVRAIVNNSRKKHPEREAKKAMKKEQKAAKANAKKQGVPAQTPAEHKTPQQTDAPQQNDENPYV